MHLRFFSDEPRKNILIKTMVTAWPKDIHDTHEA